MLKTIVERKTAVSMFFIALAMLGYISYLGLAVELLPNIELPQLVVRINSAREIDPAAMEREAIIPLEGAIGTLDQIERIEAVADRRQGTITVFYKSDADIKYAYLKLQEKIDRYKSALPEDYLVLIEKIDTQQINNMLMLLQVRGSGGVDRIRNVIDQRIVDELEAIEGIAGAMVFGGSSKSVEIIINDAIAKSYNISANTLRQLIGGSHQYRRFVGEVKDHQQHYFVNVSAEYRNVQDLGNIVVDPAVPLYLRDVAEIHYGTRERQSLSRVNGKESVTIQLVRDSQSNLIALSSATYPVIESLNRKLAALDIEIKVQLDTAEVLRDNLDLIFDLAVIGGILAIIILWFFLRNARLVSTIAVAIPISVLTAFNIFYAYDVSLNSITLVGLALAVGMLLDNSIVVLENIYRLAQQGQPPLQATINGVKEVWRSITAATLTTISIFLPMAFAETFEMKMLGRLIGVSLVSTLLISLAVALLLVPMITHYFLSRRTDHRTNFYHLSPHSRLRSIYLVFLKSSLRFPLRVICTTLLLFFSILLITLVINRNVSTETELRDFNIYLTMPAGSTLETTDLAVAELEEMLTGMGDEVEDIVSQIYEEEAVLTIRLLKNFEDIAGQSIGDIKQNIQARLDRYRTAEVGFDPPQSGQRFSGGSLRQGGGLEASLGIGAQRETIRLSGSDFELLLVIAEDIAYQIESAASVQSANINTSQSRPELHLFFEETMLNELDIPLSNIVSELNNFQEENNSGTRFKDGTEEYDIMIRNSSLSERNIDNLKALEIPSAGSGKYPLDKLSRFLYTEGNSRINRVNQEREIEVRYRFLTTVLESRRMLDAARQEIEGIIDEMEIPASIALEIVDPTEETAADRYFLFAVSLLLIYMILASVFESLLNPLIIMFTIPLAGIGSLVAVMISDIALLSNNTLIGMLILLGIVVNNGIILLDYTRILRQRGYRLQRALLVAGLARLRPIMITAITTIVALLPLALGQTEYVTQIGSPFAITVVGGLAFGTLFTLILIPTVYSGLQSAQGWFNKLHPLIRAAQIILLILSTILIYNYVDALLWKIINFFLSLFIIPGCFYFVLSSLRSAGAINIAEDAPLSIEVGNLYKQYGQQGRFKREWNSYHRHARRKGIQRLFPDLARLLENSWHFAVAGFAIYFIYFYLERPFWQLVLAIPLYYYGLFLLRELQYFNRVTDDQGPRAALKIIYNGLRWSFPIIHLLFMWWTGLPIATMLIFAVLIYFGLMVSTAADRLAKHSINIERIQGRFAGLRRRFYRMVAATPVIGKRSQPFTALKGVPLTIKNGMFGLLGPNGAGKTTLMRIICGIFDQSYGLLTINGYNTREHREELQGLIGYLPQDFGAYGNMTAYEFLSYQAILKSLTDRNEREARIKFVLEAVDLYEKRDQKIGSFSGGMRQRVGIAQTLLHLPRILVVDEPTAGLDPRERIRFRNLLVDLSRERIVIFSTHVIEDIASSCDRVAVLNRGELKYLGRPQEMAASADKVVWQFYIEPSELPAIQEKHNVVHHIQIDQRIRIRCLAKNLPAPDAVQVKPTLEDAYLWLLGN